MTPEDYAPEGMKTAGVIKLTPEDFEIVDVVNEADVIKLFNKYERAISGGYTGDEAWTFVVVSVITLEPSALKVIREMRLGGMDVCGCRACL